MKKNYICLNNNDCHLSLGNLFRIIKEASKNKASALQSEIFCSLFEIDTIQDTTVNNYCVGCRSIGGEYKQIFVNKEKRYKNKREEFSSNILRLLSIMDGKVYVVEDAISFINGNASALYLAKKLFNLAKNDREVSKDLVEEMRMYLKSDSIYETLVCALLFIVLYKVQPVYEEERKKEVLDTILKDTSISSVSLEEYLSLKLREGINYEHSLKRLAIEHNAYANFEMGCNEYYGYYKGFPRYHEAYTYFLDAASMDHAAANYMIGNMYVKGLLGSSSPTELKLGYSYLEKARELGNVAAVNTIGNMYLHGIYPLEQNTEKAIKCYKEAAEKGYAYAFNNLGVICEKEGNYKEAFSYFLESAALKESWACNKVGEYYRLGIVEKDMESAFYYYKEALESNHRILCYFAYVNLGKYFYKEGNAPVCLVRNRTKAKEYFEIAYQNGCFQGLLELFYMAVEDYQHSKTKENRETVERIKEEIEKHEKYSEEVRIEIEEQINKIIYKEIKLPF